MAKIQLNGKKVIIKSKCTILDLLQKYKKPSDTEIRDWLEGNICRCTGYQNIVAAVKEAATKM